MAIATSIEEKGFKLLSLMPRLVKEKSIESINTYRNSKLNRLKTPSNLIFYITNRCNAKCKHCFYWQEINNQKSELSLDEISKLSKSFKHPLRTIILTGGEPFLRTDLFNIIKLFYLNSSCRRITIPTNGILTDQILALTNKVLTEFPKLFLHLQISLDGPESIHDNFRKIPGCYKKATNTLDNLLQIKNNHLDISIMTTICSDNYSYLPEFVKEIKYNFPKALHKFNILRDSHIGTYRVPQEALSSLDKENNKTNSISPSELQKLFDEVINKEVSKHQDKNWQNFQRLKWQYSIDLLSNQKKILNCTATKNFAVIYPDGNVSFCEPTKPFANLQDHNMNFFELWHSDSAIQMRKKLSSCDCIHPCNLLDSMSYDSKTLIKISE